MIKIEQTNVCGWESAIRGMRNPMNSWDKSDSKWDGFGDIDGFSIGENDLNLMKRLAKGGAVHAKYRRMITVYIDITAPLYWWKEFDTYKVGTVANSCSTMHKIHAEELTFDDFSHEHLGEEEFDVLGAVIYSLNWNRQKFLETKEKSYWKKMIQMLPSSYNQKRTLMLNYEVLVGMYRDRENHKLDEWHTFCNWIKSLPYSELIIGDMGSEGE
jgi:hypothetical protein